MLAAEPRSYRASEGMAIDNDSIRLDLPLFHQIAPGSVRIPIGTFFRWIPFTLPIASVVKNQRAQPEPMEDADRIQQVRDIDPIPMAEQQNAPRLLDRNKPGGEFDRVFRLESYRLILEPDQRRCPKLSCRLERRVEFILPRIPSLKS